METGIIIIGRASGKDAMIQQLLKERPMLIGVDFSDMTSVIASLKMSFGKLPIVSKEAFENMRLAIEESNNSIHKSMIYFDETKRLFEEMKISIVYEKPQSKFMSRPINNFITK